jgi:hypothetical protein
LATKATDGSVMLDNLARLRIDSLSNQIITRTDLGCAGDDPNYERCNAGLCLELLKPTHDATCRRVVRIMGFSEKYCLIKFRLDVSIA